MHSAGTNCDGWKFQIKLRVHPRTINTSVGVRLHMTRLNPSQIAKILPSFLGHHRVLTKAENQKDWRT